MGWETTVIVGVAQEQLSVNPDHLLTGQNIIGSIFGGMNHHCNDRPGRSEPPCLYIKWPRVHAAVSCIKAHTLAIVSMFNTV